MRTLSLLALASLIGTASATPRKSLDSFGASIHGQVPAKGNLVYSPLSMSLALAMAREGAAGQTADEMDTVLGPNAGVDARNAMKALLSPPTQQPGGPMPPQLAIANRLYGDKALTFEKPFLDLTRDGYGAPIEAVDFRKNFEGARLTINKWVEGQTKDRIKNLLAPGTLDKLTRLVLVNAIYLKAQWATAFSEGATKPSAFVVDGAGSKQVPTMHADTVHTRHGSYAGARTLEIPYSYAGGPMLSMLVVVPDKAKLADVEAAYTKGGIQPFLAGTSQSAKINIALPKFTAGTDLDLGKALENLGIKRAFTDEAQFPKISKQEDLKISKVIHKAWISVDEKGTEAAAATAVVMAQITSVDPTPVIDFKVDRSFLFFIHDEHGTVLFGGRVTDPSR